MRTFEFRMTEYKENSSLDDAVSVGEINSESISHHFSGTDLSVDDLLYHFMKYLKACDYCFRIDDTLEVVNNYNE